VTTIVRTWWNDGETTSLNKNYGQTDIGAGNKLLRVEADGMLAGPSSTFTSPTGNLTADAVWGIAVVPFGTPPGSIASSFNDGTYIAARGGRSDADNIVYAPSSAIAYAAFIGPWKIKWAGQLLLTEATSVFFVAGVTVETGPGFAYFGAMTVWYA
jgi:hypothetical protein